MDAEKKLARAVSKPPEWFNVRAAQPPPWADVRVTAEGVEFMARLWAAPATNPRMRYLWGAFLSSEAHVRERLPSVTWERFSPWQLIQFVHVGAGVNDGIGACTAELPDLARGDRARIYFHAVLIAALRYSVESGVPSEVLDSDGEIPAVRWAVMKALSGAACYAMAPYVKREVARRAKDHVGYAAALLEVSRRADHLTPIFGVADAEAIGRLTWGQRRPVRRALERRGLNPSLIDDFLDGLDGQAVITVADNWGQVDPLELIGRALEGDLNVAPMAIQNDLKDAARRPSKQRRFEVNFERRPSLRDPDPEPFDHPDGAMKPDAEAEYQELLARVAADPRLWGYVLVARDAETQAQAARALGVTDRTVRNLQQNLKALLRQ
jgi:hypothetical protein